MNDFQTELSREFEMSGVSAPSIHNYMRILKWLNGGQDYSDLDFLKNVENTETLLRLTENNKQASDNTYKSRLTAILSVLRMTGMSEEPLYNTYKKKYDVVAKKLMDVAKSGEKSEKEKANWVGVNELDDVIKKHKDLAKSTTATRQNKVDYLLLSLYCHLPPRRNMDYHKMLVIRGTAPKTMSNEFNYFIVDQKMMIFHQHKNTNSKGTEIMSADNADFLEAFDIYTTIMPKLPRSAKYTKSPLLCYENGQAWKDADMIRYRLNVIFDKNVGPSMLRKIISTQKKPANKEELEDFMDLCKSMGHSVETHTRYYIKNN
jgi:hypothetical protein